MSKKSRSKILLILLSIYFYFHWTNKIFLEISHDKYLIIQRKNFIYKIFSLSGFSLMDTDDSQRSRGRNWNILIPLYLFHLLTEFTHFFSVLELRFSITVHVIGRLLLYEIYWLLVTSLWFDWLHLIVLIYLSYTINDLKNLPRYCKQNLYNTWCITKSFVGVNTDHPSESH